VVGDSLPDFKAFEKVTVIKRVYYWLKSRHNKIDNLEIDSEKHSQVIFFLKFTFRIFLLVHDSCTGDLILTIPYIHILYFSLVHPLHYSLSSPTYFLKMTLTGFNTPYSYLYRKHLNHTHPPLHFSFTLPLLLFSSL
jgi:hypothetical protein